MANEAEKAKAVPLAPRIVGQAGLLASIACCVACVVLVIMGIRKGDDSGGLLLGGLLFAPVAALGVWLFLGFVGLPDWTLESDVSHGARLLGHLSRVLGSVGAATCVALVVLLAVVPERPMPGVEAGLVVGIFVSLLIRMLGSAVSEGGRWALLWLPAVSGLVVALGIVALVLGLRTPTVIALTGAFLLYFVVKLFVLIPRFAEGMGGPHA